jgi:sugar phosphate isomerase/epimerase
LIVAFLGTVRDRFVQMGVPLPIREKLRLAALVPGVEGAEIIFPDECREPSAVLDALAETGLRAAAINVNLKGRAEFQHGALSAGSAETRKMALELIVQAKEFAVRAGAGRVTCAPLADGCDYPLQQNYAAAWGRTADLLRTAVDAGPQLPLHLENKPSDPRVRGLLSSPEIILRLLQAVDRPSAGITLNAGHISIDGLSPAESLAHVLEAGVPLYIHLGDAAGGWDWDLLPGSYHPWQLLEFLRALAASGYDGWITSDSFPLRQSQLVFTMACAQRTGLALKTAEDMPDRGTGPEGALSWKELEAWLTPGS